MICRKINTDPGICPNELFQEFNGSDTHRGPVHRSWQVLLWSTLDAIAKVWWETITTFMQRESFSPFKKFAKSPLRHANSQYMKMRSQSSILDVFTLCENTEMKQNLERLHQLYMMTNDLGHTTRSLFLVMSYTCSAFVE